MTLTNEQLRELRMRLEEEMADLRDSLDHNDRYGIPNSMADQLGELSMYDNHPADIGDELFERGKDLALRDAASLRLALIDEALERMEDGTYGICAHCGQAIPFERLQAEPAAEFCVQCQEVADEHAIESNRPVEENFEFPGFGRVFSDDNRFAQTAFDGEDAWQDVARYGTSNSAVDFEDGTDPDLMYIDSEERRGYVEDLEGYLTADLHGNPTGFTRNEAYRRNARDYTDNLNWMGLESSDLLNESAENNWDHFDEDRKE
ncbi:TraR/DksA C4-type zinc finger protein [Effusibacillus pohliae]|uniref:TraR/DksA C4-type zinc finger protein n=1 Tax=Effusibacillus pohliae TaxID=232270 RepID=UPI00036522F0|nr:TraR/DksA C4-type zinc finger protein [Effusibacillus pohliae]